MTEGADAGRGRPFGVCAVWHPRPGCEDRVETLLRTMQEQTLREPGCLVYEVHRCDDGSFFLYEQYTGRSAHERHHETAHYRRLVAGDAPRLLERRDVVRGYALGASATTRGAG